MIVKKFEDRIGTFRIIFLFERKRNELYNTEKCGIPTILIAVQYKMFLLNLFLLKKDKELR